MKRPSQYAAVSDDYATRIRQLRSKLGLTQTQFAERIGFSFVTVSRWENGQAKPSPDVWWLIQRGEEYGVDGLTRPLPEVNSVAETQEAYAATTDQPPLIDFTTDPQVVRVVVEGERLTFGHLFNPAFATETSKIDALPHQRIAVYQHMLPQPRLRFLLADDAGAGKTIMAGLYIREMLTRRLIRRVLIVPPAGLVNNWERELRNLFSLMFGIVIGADARTGNPFVGPDSDLLIVSMDTLGGDRMFSRLQEPAVEPYDLVIFDEAHKLSADRQPDYTLRRTDRYRLAEALAGVFTDDPRWILNWSTQHLLLLTATPHMGKDYPYYCLWRLLEPEVLSTFDAFNSYPADARSRHFIRRVKEEMIRFDGSRIYPMRVSDTLSYELTRGEISEQELYDQTTEYIRTVYSRARILNRSAARLAMSIFQRRLASSTYAMICSFRRRLAKLDGLIADIQSGRITPDQLRARQSRFDVPDVLDETTSDEEESQDGRELNEVVEEQVMAGVVAGTLAELYAERDQVLGLLDLAQRVDEKGDESKFERLREVITDLRFADEKILIFTEHHDTLDFLVRRLEGIGFAGQVARIHGGMDTHPNPDTQLSERDEQVEFFHKPAAEGGARFLVATDAAGEGINLQFCWLMVNYDLPWNPARLEQRMGRIHRYGQAHDPVVIINLLAGKTREGRVMKTLLDKLERIRRELSSDKVFDVIGRLFEGLSLRDYMEHAVTEEGAEHAVRTIQGTLTKEQVAALTAHERQLFSGGGVVADALPDQQFQLKLEEMRRLLPGYVRRFFEKAAPLVDVRPEGDMDSVFSLKPSRPFALDPFWPVLETYPTEQRQRFMVYRPRTDDHAIFLHPGEPFFDRFNTYVCSRFAGDALQGGVFVDPYARRPYFIHLAQLSVSRQADPNFRALARGELLESRLIGLKHSEDGTIEECPVESLLLLRGGHGLSASALEFAKTAPESCELAQAFALKHIAESIADARRKELRASLPEREAFLVRGYDYQNAELAAARNRLRDKASAGDARAKGEITRIRERQWALASRRDEAITAMRHEPELIAPDTDSITYLAHALIVPSDDPEDRKRHDDEIEVIAVKIAQVHEEAHGGKVKDVSTPRRALEAGLAEHPGFDLLSERTSTEQRYIEVKGRAGVGDVELSENEWAQACNHRGKYWLYVVYNCATPNPQLLCICDPFEKLLIRPRGGVIIGEQDVFDAAESTHG